MANLLELLWLDPDKASRIRKRAAWQGIVDEARARSRDGEAPTLAGPPVAAEDRRDVFLILARGAPSRAEAVAETVGDAVRPDGKFAPPLVLVEGELRFAFDELEALKAAVTAATPFTPGDEPLRASVDAARGLLDTPDLLASPGVIEGLLGRIREAFGRARRAVAAGYLDTQIDRALLEQRRYQKRAFDGGPHLRTSIQAPGDKAAMLVYLPAALAPRLPLYQRFPARLIAAAHLTTDQYETHPFALAALALARQVAPLATAAPRR